MIEHHASKYDNGSLMNERLSLGERGEGGWIKAKTSAYLAGAAVVLALLASTSTEKEVKAIPGKAELSTVTINIPKTCFWEYGTDLDGVGEERKTLLKPGGIKLPIIGDKIQALDMKTTVKGPYKSEVCYKNFIVTPEIGESVELNVSDDALLTVSTVPENPTQVGLYNTERSPLIDQQMGFEAFANLIGFDGVSSVSDLEAVMQGRADKAAAYRALDCLDEAQKLANPYLQDSISDQWLKTVQGLANEKNWDLDITKDDITQVNLPANPEKDILSDYLTDLTKITKETGATFVKGKDTKCDAGKAIVRQEGNND